MKYIMAAIFSVCLLWAASPVPAQESHSDLLTSGTIVNQDIQTHIRYYVLCVQGYKYLAFKRQDTDEFVSFVQMFELAGNASVPVPCRSLKGAVD